MVWETVSSFYKLQQPMEWKSGLPNTEVDQADE